MGLLTTTVGSFPKPRALKQARRRFRDGEIDAVALRHEEDQAVAAVIALQEGLGLSFLTDGEMTRGDLIDHYASRWEGLEDGLLVRCWGNRYVRRPRITGPIVRRESVLVEDWKRANAHTDLPVRATVTGPYTLMHWSFDEHYGSRRDCARAFAAVVAEEIGELAAAGATEIQLDEPAFGAVEDEATWATELFDTVGASRGSARLWSYVGFGDPDPNWTKLAALPVDCLVIGLAHQGLTTADGVAALPASMSLAAGVVDAVENAIDDQGDVRKRIEQVLERMPADRLIVTADAGLRGFSKNTAEAKLRVLVDAAAAS